LQCVTSWVTSSTSCRITSASLGRHAWWYACLENGRGPSMVMRRSSESTGPAVNRTAPTRCWCRCWRIPTARLLERGAEPRLRSSRTVGPFARVLPVSASSAALNPRTYRDPRSPLRRWSPTPELEEPSCARPWRRSPTRQVAHAPEALADALPARKQRQRTASAFAGADVAGNPEVPAAESKRRAQLSAATPAEPASF